MNCHKNNTVKWINNQKIVKIWIFFIIVVYLSQFHISTLNNSVFTNFFVSIISNFQAKINIINISLMTLLNFKKSVIILAGIAILCLAGSCGIYQPSDARKVSPNAQERVKKNLEEGRGFTIGGTGGSNTTTYQFASSNPMWRATLEILDFLPLSNVDYSGGIVSTDWYNEGTASDESIKITVRFLTNEIRADGIKIIVHKKICNIQQKCTIKKITSALERELQVAILKKAVIIEEEQKTKNKKKRPELRN